MKTDLIKMRELKRSLGSFLSSYERRKAEFGSFPKVDIDGLFALWDDYLGMLEQGGYSIVNGYRIVPNSEAARKQQDLIERGYEEFWGDVFVRRYDILKSCFKDSLSESWFLAELEAAFGNKELSKFFSHDIGHLHLDMMNQFWAVTYASNPDHVERMRHRRAAVRNFLEVYNSNPEFVFGAGFKPYKMLDFLVAAELEEEQRTEQFRPADTARQIAFVLENRRTGAGYTLVDKLTDSKANELVVDAEDFSVSGNEGVVFSIIYNLAKNAFKKLSDKPDQGYKIFVQIYEAPLGAYVITVGDSGKPIDLNVMKEKMRQRIRNEGIESIVFHDGGSKKRYEAWLDSAYRVGDLRVSDLTKVAFMARMSGFDNPDRFSSGMGLYGVWHLVNSMGGRVIYGEDFATGGPLFTCVIPRDLPTNLVGRLMATTASCITEHKLLAGAQLR